jgi:hypothetical protein
VEKWDTIVEHCDNTVVKIDTTVESCGKTVED